MCLVAVTGLWLFGPQHRRPAAGTTPAGSVTKAAAATKAAVASGRGGAGAGPLKFPTLNTNRLAYRLSNTTNSLRALEANPHAILLGNAFIDTDKPLDLKIPAQLKATGDPGAYIVQARGQIDGRFRAVLAQAGAQVVSYIPNNAYLVTATPPAAGALAGNPLVQSVLPYEPYYKIQSSLMGLAVNQEPLPPGTALTLGLFGTDPAAEQQLVAQGARIIGSDQSPFGQVVRVLAPANWTALVQLPVVQYAEPAFRRRVANDLSRVALGISPDTISPITNNYPVNGQPLTGNNVLVAVNDTGVDSVHPDFSVGGSEENPLTPPPSRVTGLNPLIDLVDHNGHGTHVAGIIAGNGSASVTPTNVGMYAEGSVPYADFRGKAPLANLFSLNMGNYSDYQLQTNAALVHALISNNSWDYGNGDPEYDLAAASYDFATRDAVPGQTGSQPMLFVFAAGNDGGGSDDGSGGTGDTILSPGTAKNVITVGALEQPRDITNIVTTISGDGTDDGVLVTNQVAQWQDETDSGNQVAAFSARGNVGIQTEGPNGRFKPDVVAPGVFVVSTSSQFNNEWDTNAYYNNPTNDVPAVYTYQVASSNALVYYNVAVPPNAVGVNITISTNNLSPIPFATNMIIYCQQSGYPDPVNNPGVIDLTTDTNGVAIPPGGGNCTIPSLQGNGFDFAVAPPTNWSGAINYNLTVDVYVTNNVGDLYSVLEGMNDSLGGYYRYETGTSMAAAGVSGVLALIEDYFTNQLTLTPSPALLKALVINGARTVGDYGLSVTNGINSDGWGMDDIEACLPPWGLFSKTDGTEGASFFVDQSPKLALATGDSHTYLVKVDTNNLANYMWLRATLVWTDPPGDPAAAIKLVNNLDLIITNMDTGDVFVGNDISADIGYNLAEPTNAAPNLDTVNNVENIILPSMLAGQYSVTVVGRSVNVNAVTAQTNNNVSGLYAPNIVQDYALVVALGPGPDAMGESGVTNAFSVQDLGIAGNPTGGQNITVVLTTNAPLMNQMVGASSPLLGTNMVPLGANTIWGPNGAVTIGQTNQWHFYIVTNTGPAADYTNAAFLTFDVDTLSIPRMGVYETEVDNATKPEANIDLFVSQNPALTNLDPTVISNCLAGAVNSRASVANAGTQFVFYTNSAPGQVYYVGVQSEDQMGSEYSFLPVFTDTPFSSLDQNGNQIVNGLLLPMATPVGNNAHPAVTNIFALAIMPMVVEKVTVTNLIQHQNFGDLLGVLSFGGKQVTLNSHDGFGSTSNWVTPIVYDDSVDAPAGTTNSDGPGSLVDFRDKSALGPWILSEVDNSAGGWTGVVRTLTLLIQPHRNLKQPGIIVAVPPGGWFVDYVDVPVGYTNLTFYGTNVTTPVPPQSKANPIQMYEKLGNDPTLTDYDQEATLTNGAPPGNSISVGPPLAEGQYFVGLYNPSDISINVLLSASLGINATVNDVFNYTSGSEQLLPDDAVIPVPAPVLGSTPSPGALGATIAVPMTVTQQVASVNVGMVVESPRISDYTFTLVSPTGQRVLLMENRGAGDTNGAGYVFIYTNVLNSTASGNAAAETNYLSVNPNPVGTTVPIIWNFYTVPDQMTVYATTNPADFLTNSTTFCLYNTGLTNNPPNGSGAQNTIPVTTNLFVPGGVTNITIIMNQFGNPAAGSGDAWTYTAGAPVTNYEYLMFTDDTNLASVPIKFAEAPFDITESSTNYLLSDFNLATNGDYLGLTNIYDRFGGWTVPTNIVTVSTVLNTNLGQLVQVTNVVVLTNNLVSVVSDPAIALSGDAGTVSNYLALGRGTITRSIQTIPGRIYNVTFWYRGPDIAAWWRGEGNALDSSDPENNKNNGRLIGRFDFPAGEVEQAFEFEDPGNTYQFAGTNNYVQVRASQSLNVSAGSGFTVEGWINPTNLSRPEPLVEWLAQMPTNTVDTNLAIIQGPVLDPATSHFYYLLRATNWETSESWAQELGGHLVTLETANEWQWVYDTFTAYGTLNRDLWTGLQYTNATGITPAKYLWSSGYTNLPFTDWAPGQPTNCDAKDQHYVTIMGPTNAYPELWQLEDNLGQTCDGPPTNRIYGVVEVPTIPTNGVQFWISGTNGTGSTNTLWGSLCANIVDTNYVPHVIYSAPGLLTSNVYQHVALTFNTNSGIAALFLNGTNVATSNLYTAGVSFVPKTDGDVLLGWDMSLYTNNYYVGEMDEMSVYGRALSDAEISAIYHVSADTTNRLIGKFDPDTTPAAGLAEALVNFGGTSNVIFGVNDQWNEDSFTFTATSNSMPLTISGIEPGILLDYFGVQQAPVTNLYYFPEQALAALNGTVAGGNWTLQVWDNRVGAYVTNVTQLVNWELSFVLNSNAVISASLPAETPTSLTVPSGQTVYYQETVPAWALEATNILVSSSQPVQLFYYSTNMPTTTNAIGTLMTPIGPMIGAYNPILSVNPGPREQPMIPGTTYYLGVQNNTAYSAEVEVEVDYDIYNLTNGAPFTDILTNGYNPVRYFEYDVSSNAYEATFQLLQLSGNADLVVRKGGPLPDLSSSDYGSFNPGRADENIYVLTNSAPVPLAAGRWYLGVFNRDGSRLQYSVLAKELDLTNPGPTLATSVMPAIINLTNGAPVTWTAGPGAALTNFFHFAASNSVAGGTNVLQGLRFELYNLSGNGDLTVQTNALPLAPPFFQTSQNHGTDPEVVFIYTNNVLTNLAGDWYLGVPNRVTNTVSFTIVAEILTNLYFPAFPEAQGAGEGAAGAGHAGVKSTVYHVFSTADDGSQGTLRAAVGTTNCTVVFDVAGTINLLSPLVITNSNLTIAGQTSPGGITVAGNMTTVTNAHDVIVRDVRFRRGSADDSFQFANVSNAIADHISAEWTSDNLVSVLSSSNVTVQWSMLADSLYSPPVNPTNPPTGSLVRGGSGAVSLHHNLYADNYSGSPRLGDNVTLDFVNNVIYNWGYRPGLSAGTGDLSGLSATGWTNQLNYVANYLIAGADTAGFAITNYNITNIAFFGGFTNGQVATWLFQTNNFIDSDTNGVLNGTDTGWGMFTNDYTRFGWAFSTPPVEVDEAYVAYERVLDFAGASMALRDFVDTNIANNVRYQTGRLISAPPLAGMVGWWKGENNGADSAGGNNATFPNGIGYLPGKVGTAFNLNGSTEFLLVTATNTAFNVGSNGTGITFEEWIKPNTAVGEVTFLEYEAPLGTGNGSDTSINFTIPPGTTELQGNLMDLAMNGHLILTGPVVTAGVWQHIALTYDQPSGVACIYVNGIPVKTQNLGSFTLRTTLTNIVMGARTTFHSVSNPGDAFNGEIDEISLYKRALSASEIAAIYHAGSAGKFMSTYATEASPLPYLDTDQDGLPDFWESTFTPSLIYTNSNNHDRDGDGYTDIEEYNNWLAGPHAVTVTNGPVGVDLYQLCGESGRLAFYVTNGIHGFIYLTNVLGSVTNFSTSWSNSFAIFTPTNNPGGTNYFGYGSFDFYVTNLDTAAYFGPETVSVIVSAVPITINSNMPPIITQLNGGQESDPTNYGGSDYWSINVPSGSSGVLFEIENPTAPMAMVVSKSVMRPSLSSYDYYTNQPPAPTTLQIVVLTNSAPVPFTSGWWYMAAVNESGSNVVYKAKITPLGIIVPPEFLYPTNTTVITNFEPFPLQITCVATDLNNPTLPLSFALVSGPTNLTVSTAGVLNWTPNAAQAGTSNGVAVSVSNGAYTVTNNFGIVVEVSNLPPVLPTSISNQVVIVPGGALTVANTAINPNAPNFPVLGYSLSNSVPGVNVPTIDANGIITWAPTLAQVGTYFIQTVVTDSVPLAVNGPSLSATNSFYVTVLMGLPPGSPGTNVVPPSGTNWYEIAVPPNAIYATNTLISASGPVNLWFSTTRPPSIGGPGDAELVTNSIAGVSVIGTNLNSTPLLVPGSVYYLGVQNPSSTVAVTNSVKVSFDLVFPPPEYFANFKVTPARVNGTNGYLATWSAAGSNQFHLQWSPALVPAQWAAFNGVISANLGQLIVATNSQFQYFDDGSQTGGLAPVRFYRLQLLNSPTNTPPFFLYAPGQFKASPGVLFTFTNSAADWDLPAQSLTYSVTNSLGAANLNINPVTGVITWTPTPAQAGLANVITTVVTDNGVPAQSTTNSFTVVVNGAPEFSSISVGPGGVTFQWTGATNAQFEIRWTTNLAPANWTIFPGTITSSGSNFSFVDTNTPLLMMKFYQLMLLP
jgi:subtilisin-like proprotein convertase family protein